jgi:hypothetical protein
MLAPMTPGESAEVMRRWAALAPTAGEVTWTPVQEMIQAAEDYGRGWEGRVLETAEKYKAKLGGLDDPLSVKMTWIERSHELAYSRWLAWVLGQLGSADAVWRVLGLPGPPAEVRKLETELEVRITPEDRLDIIVYCDGAPRVIIETKLRSAEECFLDDQLGRYKKQVDDGHAKGVLIVLDAEKDSYEGFVVRRWKDVCVGLRRELLHVARGKHLGVAMILAFVGAVEQNLLGFPSLDSLAASPMLNPRVAAHIEESMNMKEIV